MTNESNNTGFHIEGWKDIRTWDVHNGHCGIGHRCYSLIPIIYDDALSLYENVCKAFQYISDLNNNLEALKAYLAALKEQIMEWIKEGVADELAKQLPPLLEEINQKIDDLNTTLTNEFHTDLENLRAELDAKLNTTNENVLKNTQSIINLETNITTITNTLTEIERQLQEISGDTAGIEADIEALKTAIANINTEITSIKTDVSENIANIDSLLVAVGSINDSIGTINGQISGINTSISSVTARLDALENANYLTESAAISMFNSRIAFRIRLLKSTTFIADRTEENFIEKTDLKNAFGITFAITANPGSEPQVTLGQIYPLPQQTVSNLDNFYDTIFSRRGGGGGSLAPLDYYQAIFSLHDNDTGYDLTTHKVWQVGADGSGTAYTNVTARQNPTLVYITAYAVYPVIV